MLPMPWHHFIKILTHGCFVRDFQIIARKNPRNFKDEHKSRWLAEEYRDRKKSLFATMNTCKYAAHTHQKSGWKPLRMSNPIHVRRALAALDAAIFAADVCVCAHARVAFRRSARFLWPFCLDCTSSSLNARLTFCSDFLRARKLT